MANPYQNFAPAVGDGLLTEGFDGGSVELGLQIGSLSASMNASGTKTTTTGSVYMTACHSAGLGPISEFYTVVTTGNGTPIAAQSLMGLYQLTPATGILTLIAQSIDMGTVWGSTGKQVGTIASGSATSTVNSIIQVSLTAPTKYYIGVLNVATTGVTLAATTAVSHVAAISGNAGAIVSSVATSPHQPGTFICGTSQTVLPATVNLGTATITVQTQVLLVGAY